MILTGTSGLLDEKMYIPEVNQIPFIDDVDDELFKPIYSEDTEEFCSYLDFCTSVKAGMMPVEPDLNMDIAWSSVTLADADPITDCDEAANEYFGDDDLGTQYHKPTPGPSVPLTIAPLSNPLPDHPLMNSTYKTLEDLMQDLDAYGQRALFAVVKLKGQNPIKDFGPSRVELGCQKGKIRASEAHSRTTTTSKRGCTWKAIAKALAVNNVDGAWRWSTASTAITPLLLAFEETAATQRFRPEHKGGNQRIRPQAGDTEPKQALGGYTPSQALIKALDEEGIPHTVLWEAEAADGVGAATRRPEGLFWTYPWCEKQRNLYPWAQMYDDTYRTNNRGLALFQTVGKNHLKMVFSCAFGLINDEKQQGFDWPTDQVNATRVRIGAPPPTIPYGTRW
ncbi:hypothetical protein OQA88_13270 [Cercophora sp. LCS_1]